MTPPASDVRYFDTRQTRRRFLFGGAAAVVLGAAAGAVLLGTDVLSRNDGDDTADTPIVIDDPATEIDEAAEAAAKGADVEWTSVGMIGDSITAGSQASLEEVLGAEVALAAGTGALARFRHRRDYRLWQALATRQATRPRLWWAWVSAQPTARERARVGLRLIGPRLGRLRGSLGHRPSAADYVGALRVRVHNELDAARRAVAARAHK